WSVYGPAEDWAARFRFWSDIAPWHHFSATPLTITGGDFNVLTSPIERSDLHIPDEALATRDVFLQRLEEGALVDVWRHRYQRFPGFTFTQQRRGDMDVALHARLDRF